ncbi:MAG: hypothetical protein ACYDCX_13495 [Acidithiobacillus sp.]
MAMNNCKNDLSAIPADISDGIPEIATVIGSVCKSLEIARYDLASGRTGASEATLSRLIVGLTSLLDRIATASPPGAVHQMDIPSSPDQHRVPPPT